MDPKEYNHRFHLLRQWPHLLAGLAIFAGLGLVLQAEWRQHRIIPSEPA